VLQSTAKSNHEVDREVNGLEISRKVKVDGRNEGKKEGNSARRETG
jgi:hypothetical protein